MFTYPFRNETLKPLCLALLLFKLLNFPVESPPFRIVECRILGGPLLGLLGFVVFGGEL